MWKNKKFTLGYWLKMKRLDAGMSQKKLSEKIFLKTGKHIPQSSVSSWETEKSIPPVDIVVAIVTALDISFKEIPWEKIDL